MLSKKFINTNPSAPNLFFRSRTFLKRLTFSIKYMINKIKTFYNSEQFQGWNKKRKYFEGWYYKVINADETKAFAFIPGVAMDEAGNKQSFIQVLDGKKQTAVYHKFDFKQFLTQRGDFKISIQQNQFTKDSVILNLPDIKGSLQFTNLVPWTKSLFSPGIMGPFSYVPFMECYHGIVSLDHSIKGQLEIDGETVDFTGGRGYTEKDWGQSFPSAYTWMQSNHFSSQGISVKASVAKIPWIGSSFVGFIAGVWIYDRLIQFTTYNKSVLRKSKIDATKVELIIENKNYRIEILARRNKSTTLASPILGLMDGRIEESMTTMLEVVVTDMKTQQSIFNDTGRNAGLEVAGNIQDIII